VVEVDVGAVRPDCAAEFFAADQFALADQEVLQHPGGLRPQAYAAPVLDQFPRRAIELEPIEAIERHAQSPRGDRGGIATVSAQDARKDFRSPQGSPRDPSSFCKDLQVSEKSARDHPSGRPFVFSSGLPRLPAAAEPEPWRRTPCVE
jgi:hypothetical protein